MLGIELLLWATILVGANSRSIRSLREENSEISCKCDKRYWAHYEVKGCYPVFEGNTTDCPTRFECPTSPTNDSQLCVYKGQYYTIGSEINTDNPCQICSCRFNEDTNTSYIPCAVRECPYLFRQRRMKEGCRLLYTDNQCCPTKTECETEQLSKCEWRNKTYYLGEKIYPEEDPCLVCLCTEGWKGLGSTSCRRVDCVMEKDRHLLKRGCIPIYHEKSCCPVEYHCPETQEFNVTKETEIKNSQDNNKCYFDNNEYEVGAKLEYSQQNNCVTCTCCTPPDFTCVHRSCPPPPNQDYEHCRAVYEPDSCCPEYNCDVNEKLSDIDEAETNDATNIGPPPGEDPCNEMTCAEGEQCQLRQIRCGESSCPVVPTCVFINYNCPTPLCATGCYVVDVDKDSCPTCACGNESISEDLQKICTLPNCTGHNCHFISGEDGCPECSCDPPCPVCPPECQLQTDVSEGRCPICICNEIIESSNSEISKTTCPVPLCEGVNCTTVVGDDNCTQCVCSPSPPPCIPPKCEPGCELEKNVSEERCPECVCLTTSTSTEEITTANPVQITTETKRCPAPDCRGYNCRIFVGLDGCQTCTCESRCPPTRCIPGCFVESDPPPDRCPGCICHITAASEDPKSNES